MPTDTMAPTGEAFTPISAEEAQSFLAHARKDFRGEDNELGYVPVQPCDLERMSLTILALLAAARQGEETQTRRPSDAGKAAALYAAEYHRLKRRYREACEAIARKHNNPECACMFCDDLRAARAASQPEEVSRGE